MIQIYTVIQFAFCFGSLASVWRNARGKFVSNRLFVHLCLIQFELLRSQFALWFQLVPLRFSFKLKAILSFFPIFIPEIRMGWALEDSSYVRDLAYEINTRY